MGRTTSTAGIHKMVWKMMTLIYQWKSFETSCTGLSQMRRGKIAAPWDQLHMVLLVGFNQMLGGFLRLRTKRSVLTYTR